MTRCEAMQTDRNNHRCVLSEAHTEHLCACGRRWTDERGAPA